MSEKMPKLSENSLTPESQEKREKARERVMIRFIGGTKGEKEPQYIKEILDADEAPEAYIFNGRRILRNVLGTLIEELKKAGKIDKYAELHRSLEKRGSFQTNDPEYKQFVDALRNIRDNYEDLYQGSERIAKTNKKVKAF